MTTLETLKQRANDACELCQSKDGLSAVLVAPRTEDTPDNSILLCSECAENIDTPSNNVSHWHCLNDSMWSQIPAVQVSAWRVLNKLSAEVWAADLLDMLYLDEENKKWAEALSADENKAPTLDSNGTPLQAGDTVTLIKDLVVKGAGFTAKRGTVVRNIGLPDNPEHIEGKVNGVRVVLVAAYMKKS